MRTTTADYKAAIYATDRECRGYIKFNNDGTKIIRGVDGLISITLHEQLCDEERPMINCACSRYVEVEFFNSGLPGGVSLANSYIDTYMGVVTKDTGTAPVGSIEPDTATVEYIWNGRFFISEIDRGKLSTKVLAYDEFSKLNKQYVPTVTKGVSGYSANDILIDVLTQCNFTTAVGGISGYVQEIPECTCRQMMGWLIGAYSLGSNATMSRTNASNFSPSTLKTQWTHKDDADHLVTDNEIYLGGLADGDTFTVNSVTTGTADNPIVVGSGTGIVGENPYLTQANATTIYNDVNGITFKPMTIEFRGNPAIDICDVLKVTSGGTSNYCYVQRLTTTFNGGIKQKIECFGDSEFYYSTELSPTASQIKNAVSSMAQEIQQEIETADNGVITKILDLDGSWKELVIANNQDLSAATSVWRWNINGLAHSTAYSGGTYNFAVDMNGRIIANAIQTGILTDALGKNSLNLDTGEFHLEALGDFGGRNLIQNTLEPSVATAANYPKLVGGQDTTVGGTATTAEHGIKTTAASNGAWLQIGFGGASDMNGLVAGRTYTFSCDFECKMLSGLTSGSYNFNLWTYVNGSNDTNYRIVAIDTANKGTVIKMPVSITFTIPSNATAFRFYIRCQSSTATYALANDYIELANIKLERGSVATAWSPAPEDQVGNDEIISKINVSPEVVQISAAKVNLTGYVTMTNLSTSGQTTINGANITTGLIQDAANKNSWNLNTGAFTITQGSINIVTSSATYDQIVLQNGNFTSANRASGLNVTYTSGADTFESSFVSGGFSVQKNGSIVVSTSAGSLETLFTVGDANGTNPGLIHLYGSQKHSIFGSYAGLQIQSLSNANDRLILDFDTSTNDGCLQFCKSAASGLPVMELLNTGLKFYNTSGTVTATYPADPTNFLKDNGLSVASLKDCTSETVSTSGTTKTYTLTNGTYLITTTKYNNSSTANDGVWLASVHTGGTSHLSALLAPTGTTTVSISGATLTVVTGTNNERITITHLNF